MKAPEIQQVDGSAKSMAPEELRASLEKERAARREVESRLEDQARALQAVQSQLHDLVRQAKMGGRARLDFLDILQHELRTPLHGILGTASVLLEEKLDEDHRELVELVDHFGRRLQRVVGDLLEYSRLEAGGFEGGHVRFAPRAMARGALDAVAKQAKEKSLDLRLEVADAVPDQVEADEHSIHELMLLLLNNAVKFTERGRVTLSLRWTDDEKLRIEVRDTGIGIPADRMDRIFEPYVQADASMTRRFAGAGLGLAIARYLVHALYGEISAESKEGVGSTFRATIPVQLPKN